MAFTPAALRGMFAVAALVASLSHAENAAPMDAEFRGCDAAGWCRFKIDVADPARSLIRVRPDGIPRPADGPTATAVRNRLNALMSDFIHQAKHIVLHDVRRLDDGTYAASVTVTGIELASDPVLAELGAKGSAGR